MILPLVTIATVAAIHVQSESTTTNRETRLQTTESVHQSDSLRSLLVIVHKYREAVSKGDSTGQRALLSDNARRWFETTEGDGFPIRPGAPGPWYHWDKFFNASSSVERADVHGDTVEMTLIETNDFYRLIDRKPTPTNVSYFLDSRHTITGILIARSFRPVDRFDEFKEWARTHRSEDLKYLMPDGEIIPDLQRAKIWREILTVWRQEIGLAPIQ